MYTIRNMNLTMRVYKILLGIHCETIIIMFCNEDHLGIFQQWIYYICMMSAKVNKYVSYKIYTCMELNQEIPLI